MMSEEYSEECKQRASAERRQRLIVVAAKKIKAAEKTGSDADAKAEYYQYLTRQEVAHHTGAPTKAHQVLYDANGNIDFRATLARLKQQ
jgi:hypothetical protein